MDEDLRNEYDAIPTIIGFKDGSEIATFAGPQINKLDAENFLKKVL